MRQDIDKNTVIGRVQTQERLNKIAALCNEHGLKFIIGLEPDKPEDISEIERRLNPPSPYTALYIGRNDSCPCGSGKKYKNATADKK
jgi:uncharacterized protein YecA (UPF0149 family)